MKTQSTMKKIGLGVGAAAAAAAGIYYLYGSKDAEVNRRKVKSWMLKAKAEVMEELENLKVLNEGAYENVVAKVMAKYKAMKGMDTTEILALGKRMQGHWKDIRAELEKAGHDASSTAKKEMKKAKKVIHSSPKKSSKK